MSQLPKERYDRNIETTNFRLKRTVGTRTRYVFEDKRTGIRHDFDAVRVGMEIGRGDTIQLFVTDEDVDTRPGRATASIYQHDVPSILLGAFEHIEEHGELPEPDFVKEEL